MQVVSSSLCTTGKNNIYVIKEKIFPQSDELLFINTLLELSEEEVNVVNGVELCNEGFNIFQKNLEKKQSKK